MANNTPVRIQTALKHRFWTDVHSRRFEVLGLYPAREEINEHDEVTPIMWIEYRNQTTGDTYTCELTAFTSRFTPTAD